VDAALVTGIAGFFGGAGGAVGARLIGGFIDNRSHDRSIRDEDARRWQHDRRVAYAAYLALANVMLREIDGVASPLPYSDESEPISASDDASVVEGLLGYFSKWDDELQPALGEVQLLASPEVADMADRVSGALMEITAPVEQRLSFTDYHPDWLRAKELVVALTNVMRRELGLPEGAVEAFPARRDPDWPWLSRETTS
jgi:hypothetical protein